MILNVTMLNASVLNPTTLHANRPEPAGTGHGSARCGHPRKKHGNLDCHPGASAGILTPPLPRRRSRPRAVREAV